MLPYNLLHKILDAIQLPAYYISLHGGCSENQVLGWGRNLVTNPG